MTMHRRTLLSTSAGAVAACVTLGLGVRPAQAGDFGSFLAGLRGRAAAAGIPRAVIDDATANLTPNADVLKLDHHQPEFTLTWAEYSSRVINATRIADGRTKAAASKNLLAAITSRFGVAAPALLGIWGIETNYGTTQGDFYVIDALATLAWDRGSSYFAGQAISAMRIIARDDAPRTRLLGSYAGAMGQPQFMPSVYLSTAVSFSGSGRPDIWGSDADALASMGNYLARAGWRPGEPSAEAVVVPPGIDPALAGRTNRRTLGFWRAQGVRRLPGASRLPDSFPAALLLPDGPGGAAFLVYPNFAVIRRYNASDYYALAVGLLGGEVLA
jgi:peptidoglycan lytic transglycosylase B